MGPNAALSFYPPLIYFSLIKERIKPLTMLTLYYGAPTTSFEIDWSQAKAASFTARARGRKTTESNLHKNPANVGQGPDKSHF
jgi:hypothetical protein